MSDRPSFVKNKINQSYYGSTGITGTSKSSVEPSSHVEYNDTDGYNASKTLFENIDLLGQKLGVNNSDPIVDIVEENYEEMSEEEAATAYVTKEYMSAKSSRFFDITEPKATFEFQFCTQCGNKYNLDHKFCGKCGTQRQ
jgi:hypothetical protein